MSANGANGAQSLSARLQARVAAAIGAEGGWMPFDRFMALALYEPGLGYYARDSRQFGALPGSGSDFTTAPELSPLFGRALAVQVAQALDAAQADEIIEFGAGSGALAAQLLTALGPRVRRYSIVDLSAVLRERQQHTLQAWAGRVQWLDALPGAMHGVVLGNEVLDAMPVQLLHWSGLRWQERGVVLHEGALHWGDRDTDLQPPVAGPDAPHAPYAPYAPGTVTEIHLQAEAFIRTLAERLTRGAAFFIDYGFPEAEYYHPQRTGGTLMCHRAHQVDTDPLADVGEKDITAHVDFTGIALAGQDAGFDVLGYTSQARFLINCGLPALLEGADLRTVVPAQKLIHEHEMGELFKVIAFGRGITLDPLGFAAGDRMHTL